MILKHMKTEKLLLVKEMITQLVFCWIILTSAAAAADAASAADAGIHKKVLGYGKRPFDLALPTTTLIILNNEMEDIIK